MSRHEAAAHFGVAVSTAICWLARFRQTGSVAAGQMGGHKPPKISGEQRDWLIARCRARAFTLRGLVAELAERGLKVDYHSIWDFVHAEKLSYQKPFSPANGIARTLHGAGRNGASTRRGLTRSGWSSSTRPGPKPTWHRYAAGRSAGQVAQRSSLRPLEHDDLHRGAADRVRQRGVESGVAGAAADRLTLLLGLRERSAFPTCEPCIALVLRAICWQPQSNRIELPPRYSKIR